MAIHNTIGKKGEEIAAAYLIGEGYDILARNWRFKKTEIDILAFKDNFLIVVEVKTRTYRFLENLSEIVPVKKQKAIINAADRFIDSRELKNEVRFDIVFIVLNGDNYQLEHIKEAFTTTG
jgi:putative endonuclease